MVTGREERVVEDTKSQTLWDAVGTNSNLLKSQSECVCVWCLQRPEGASYPQLLRVPGGCEMPGLGTGNQTQILWQSSKCPSPQQPPFLHIFVVVVVVVRNAYVT